MRIFNTNQYQYNIRPQIINSQLFAATNYSLSRDAVSFGAMKKSQFEGIELAVVEKFKAPIEKFNILTDLQNWAKARAKNIIDMDFGGRHSETTVQRKTILKEWSDYMFKENGIYTFATALLILNAITKGIKPDNDKLPPVLNKGVLADCISEIDKNTKSDSKYDFDLNKMYETKLQALFLEETKMEVGNTGWVKIPSKKTDPKNFETNFEKLKALSHKNWCTKSFKSKSYLSNGDFHVYLENGQPKIGIRFIGKEIEEIQGEKNNGKIPFSYFEEVKKYIDENAFSLSENVTAKMTNAELIKQKVDNVKLDLKTAIETSDAKTIFEYFGINIKDGNNGLLTISEYCQPKDFSFSDCGIDENKLLANVKKIEGDADFSSSEITKLPILQSIGGNADFSNSEITKLNSLQSIGGNANFYNSKSTNLDNLLSIGKNAYFTNSQITNLPSLQSIGGWVNFYNSKLTNLDNLLSIGEDAYFTNSQITNLPCLQNIGGSANFYNSKLTNLDNLLSIGENADFANSKMTELPNLQNIGGDANFNNSQVTSLPSLQNIGGDANFRNSQVTNLDRLQNIGGNVVFYNSKLIRLDRLQFIGGNANFYNAELTNLPRLQSIGGDASFYDSKLTHLPELQSIGGNAHFYKSRLTILPKLQSIGKNAYFKNSQIINLPCIGNIGVD